MVWGQSQHRERDTKANKRNHSGAGPVLGPEHGDGTPTLPQTACRCQLETTSDCGRHATVAGGACLLSPSPFHVSAG